MLPHTLSSNSDPVTLLQFEGQVYLAEVLEAKTAQCLNLSLLLGFQHQLQLLHPLWVALDEVLLQLQQQREPPAAYVTQHARGSGQVEWQDPPDLAHPATSAEANAEPKTYSSNVPKDRGKSS